MKIKAISFLFFFLSITPMVFYGQGDADTLAYYKRIVDTPQEKKELDKAYAYFVEQSLLHKSQNDRLGQAYDLIYISFIQKELGFLYDSEDSAVKALAIIDLINTKNTNSYKITLYNQLGIVYKELMDYKASLAYYKKAVLLEGREEQISILFNNIGNTYHEMGHYDKALHYFNKAKEHAYNSQNNKELARVLDNLGFAQLKVNDPHALSNMQQALALRRADNDPFGTITSLLHMAAYHHEQGNKKLASKNIGEALEISKAIKNIKYTISSLKIKLDLSEYPDVISYKRLTDSIKKANHQARNNYAAKKYSLEKQTLLTEEKALETQKYKQQSIIYLLLGFMLSLASIGVYFFLKAEHKKNNIVQIYKTETRISKRVHDEVANDIFLVMNNVQKQNVNNEALLNDLEKIYSKTRDISKENGDINTTDDFTETLHFLFLNYKTPQIEIITKGLKEIRWDAISENKKTTLFRVLQELMTNMKKHSEATIVVIKFEHINKKLVVTYKDNGVGTSSIKGNGLLNVENRIKTVNGTINFDSTPTAGFKSKIKM